MKPLLTAAALAALITVSTAAAADAPKAARRDTRTVTAPVKTVAYEVASQIFSLSVTLQVEEGDPRWADRHARLPGYAMSIDGRKASAAEVARWLPTAAKAGADWRSWPAELVEVEIVFDPNRYGGIGRADFRVVPWAKHHPLDEVDAQVVRFFRRRGVPFEDARRVATEMIRSAVWRPQW